MASLVGLDPVTDFHWVTDPSLQPMDLFVKGEIDAFLAGPPDLQEVRARNIGHVIVSSIADRPWSQYYCCMLATRIEFARNYPVATKRVLRAILRAVDLCVSEPQRAAQLLVDRGDATRYDYALQALSEIRYDVWRDFDAEDTLRFYGLRMHEAGMIKSSPQYTYRRAHGLAFPQRTKARAESLNSPELEIGGFLWQSHKPDAASRPASHSPGLLASAGVGACGPGGLGKSLAAEPPPEITTIRFERDPVLCITPQVADELLRGEGFTDIRYVEVTEAHVRAAEAANISMSDQLIASGEVDFARDFVPSHIASMEAGVPHHHPRRIAFRVLRGARKRRHPQHRRSEGQDGGSFW